MNSLSLTTRTFLVYIQFSTKFMENIQCKLQWNPVFHRNCGKFHRRVDDLMKSRHFPQTLWNSVFPIIHGKNLPVEFGFPLEDEFILKPCFLT